ncbi:MAG TPA: PKD domain-containing protein [Thermoplasmata archaeon]|nr:PKD domain-containing protein [Thermoplasmata archaeon]
MAVSCIRGAPTYSRTTPVWRRGPGLAGRTATLLCLLTLALAPCLTASGSPSVDVPSGLILRVVRTGPVEASVLGVAVSLNDLVELMVDGAAVGTTTPVWNLDYWFLHVPVTDRSVVRTRIGPLQSSPVQVPPYTPTRVGPAGFLYADGARLLRDGTPVQLFGVNEPTAFSYALIASGLYGWSDPDQYWGDNGLLPSGPDARITNVSTPDALWSAYFRYFLHYEANASEPLHPAPNLLRIWIVDENFGLEKAYAAWRADPSAFWRIFDSLVYWAGRAGVYLVPVLGHMDVERDNAMYDVTSPEYARHLALVRAIVARYDEDPHIAMWDLWNEADVNNDAYWVGVGGIDGFRTWASRYLADVKPYASNHLLTLGTGGWTLFPGVPSFGWQYHFFWNDIPGLEVSSHHGYATSEDSYLVDWQTAWHEALGIPHFEGEYGYNEYPGPSGIGVGYWPWFTERTRDAGWPAIATLVFLDNGRGAYADYPFDGALPDYEPGDPRAPDAPPVAAFEVRPPSPRARSLTTFNASVSSDDFGIVRSAWWFGDGSNATGVTVAHLFPYPGDYPVVLLVADAEGHVDTWTLVVHVAPARDLASSDPGDVGSWP